MNHFIVRSHAEKKTFLLCAVYLILIFFINLTKKTNQTRPNRQNTGDKLQMINFSFFYNFRFYMPIAVVMALIVPTLVPWYFWGESISNGFFLNFVRIVVAYQAVLLINSVTHAWGKRPYDKDISATENLFTSFFSVGEGFHNYHHTFPQDYRASEHGWFLNGSGAFIDIMAFFGQVTDRKMASSDIIEQRKQRTGDRSLKSDF